MALIDRLDRSANQFFQETLAFDRQFVPILLKLLPGLAVHRAGVSQSGDSASSLGRVERRQTACRSLHLSGHSDDFRVALMKLSEEELVVEIQRQ